MKLYTYHKNTGNWNGYRINYFFANSDEEAENYKQFLKDKELYVGMDWDIDKKPHEVTGDDILRELTITKEDRKNFVLDYTINDKNSLPYWEWFEEWSFDGEVKECDDAGYRCSECKKTPLPEEYFTYFDDPENPPPFEFCPHCGKKMNLQNLSN